MIGHQNLTRSLLTSLELALPFIPHGDARHLAEDTIADTRHALGLPPLPDSDPPDCGQRCGDCARCQVEDAWVDEYGRINDLARQARTADLLCGEPSAA